MTEILTGLQQARGPLGAVRSAMAALFKRWSREPNRWELVPKAVAALEDEHCFREAVKAVAAEHGLRLKTRRNRDLWLKPVAGAS